MKLQLALIKKMLSLKPISLLLVIFTSVTEVMSAFMGVYLTKLLVSLVINEVPFTELITTLSLYILGMLFVQLVYRFFMVQLEKTSSFVRMGTFGELTNSIMTFDYQLFEDESIVSLQQQAFQCSNSDSALFGVYPKNLQSFITVVLQIFIYAGLFLIVDLSVIWILLLMMISLSVYRRFQNHMFLKTKPAMDKVSEQLQVMKRTSGKFSMAKDMRIYGVKNWFKDIQEELLLNRQKIHGKRLRIEAIGNLISASFSVILTALGYWILVDRVIAQSITVDEFVLLFAAITQLTSLSSLLVDRMSVLTKNGKEFEVFQQYINYPQPFNHHSTKALPTGELSIEFDNVSFTYPNAEQPLFENLSFKINANEKCALVGLNGSGKTTLVKLLCNLYKPDNGQILINGIDNQSYHTLDYYQLFSAVFQDTHVWPFTIKELIIQGHPFDEKKYQEVLKLSGMDSVIEKAINKDDTLIASSIDENAIALSGGQMQKLKLAQALYKDGRILILDEPTAALDPLAEAEVYQNYFDLAKEKTSLFITHRLSSTQFCDRILYLQDGQIIESGTHQELMGLKGQYYDMYEKQSYYYVQQGGSNV